MKNKLINWVAVIGLLQPITGMSSPILNDPVVKGNVVVHHAKMAIYNKMRRQAAHKRTESGGSTLRQRLSHRHGPADR